MKSFTRLFSGIMTLIMFAMVSALLTGCEIDVIKNSPSTEERLPPEKPTIVESAPGAGKDAYVLYAYDTRTGVCMLFAGINNYAPEGRVIKCTEEIMALFPQDQLPE